MAIPVVTLSGRSSSAIGVTHSIFARHSLTAEMGRGHRGIAAGVLLVVLQLLLLLQRLQKILRHRCRRRAGLDEDARVQHDDGRQQEHAEGPGAPR